MQCRDRGMRKVHGWIWRKVKMRRLKDCRVEKEGLLGGFRRFCRVDTGGLGHLTMRAMRWIQSKTVREDPGVYLGV